MVGANFLEGKRMGRPELTGMAVGLVVDGEGTAGVAAHVAAELLTDGVVRADADVFEPWAAVHAADWAGWYAAVRQDWVEQPAWLVMNHIVHQRMGSQ